MGRALNAALLFTDVVDSTALTQRLGPDESARLWSAHDTRARDLLRRHLGREGDRADGFMLLFDSADHAAGFALDYHAALADLGVRARAGLHVGEVTLRPNAPDDIARGARPVEVDGLAKPIAARIMALAHGGGTLLSAAAADALRSSLTPAQSLARHGHYRLKGVDEPVEIHELVMEGQAGPMPPPDGEKAYRVVRDGDLWAPARAIPHNLPPERDSFVGRDQELRGLAHWLDGGARLVTLLGTGGSGKTRLARRCGRGRLGDWPGGVYFCDLSETRSIDGIHFAVAGALGIALAGADVAQQLVHALQGRGRCLVILDNFEQVAAHAATTLGRWLDQVPDAAFVVTSRERLQLGGEQVLPIGALPLDAAIDLFATRAAAQRHDFALDAASRPVVAELVRLLDGLPLAIELAAARIRILSPSQIVERLRDRFALLGPVRGGGERQSTLRTAIDWSWNLLHPAEQAALAQCSVFEGPFSLAAAEAVLVLPEGVPTMDAIQALVDKSLLRDGLPSTPSAGKGDDVQFSLYLSIHGYAEDKLGPGSPAAASTQTRHGRHFAGLSPDTGLGGPVAARAPSRADLDNLVAACRRAIERADAVVAVAAYERAWRVLDAAGPIALAEEIGASVVAMPTLTDELRHAAALALAAVRRRLGKVAQASDELDALVASTEAAGDRLRMAESLSLRGNVRLGLGRSDEARRDLDRALALFRELGDEHGEASALNRLGALASHTGRMQESRERFEAALALWRRIGDVQLEAGTLGNIGTVFAELGDFEAARTCYDGAIAILHDIGASRDEAIFVYDLAIVLFDRGRLDEARACCERALAIFRSIGDRRFQAMALGQLGDVHAGVGDEGAARPAYEQALSLSREVGDRRGEGYVLEALGNLSLRAGHVDAARDALEQALALHRGNANPRWTATALASLGDALRRQGRSREAAKLLAEGEALLRDLNSPVELAILLCVRGQLEAGCGRSPAASAALAEAEAIARTIGVEPGSRLAAGLATLRRLLEARSPKCR